MQPFRKRSKIKFEYAGQTISILLFRYAQFIEFFVPRAAHFLVKAAHEKRTKTRQFSRCHGDDR